MQALALSDNTSDDKAGGLWAYHSKLTIRDTTLDGNQADTQGGGIYNTESTLQLINVTLSGNQAGTSGGGIYNDAGGSTPTVLTLTNVTLKDNGSPDGGALYNFNDAETLAFLKNSVLADSSSGGNCKGKAITSAKYSLSTDNTCSLSAGTNQNGVAALLNVLAYVGGATKTHLPKPGSPLIDMVSGADYPNFDQRSVGRPVNLGADAGAVNAVVLIPARCVPSLYLPIILR